MVSIFAFGPYDYSTEKGTIYLHKFVHWKQFSTGSIISENFIITAAHCMEFLREGNYFNVQAGRTSCLLGADNEYLREVVVNRIPNDEHQSIFEHPNWFKERGENYVWGYDIALIRLDEPYILPKGVYNNEPINRICLHSSIDLPKTGCLKNIYFSGYGLKFSRKTVEPTVIDPTSKLTWFRLFRTTPKYCENVMNFDIHEWNAVCCSPVLPHADLWNSDDGMDLGTKNLTEVKEYPDTCPGDSGGPFIYYMRYDKEAEDKYNVLTDGSTQTGYRALLLTTLFGTMGKTELVNECDSSYWIEQQRKFGFLKTNSYYKPVSVGPMVYDRVNETYFTSALATTATGYSDRIGTYVKYPSLS